MTYNYGLIGTPLTHSFSQKYFEEKFLSLNLPNHSYTLFPISGISQLPVLIEDHSLRGFNVTHPYKESILPLLHEISPEAREIGAVNTVLVSGNRLVGHNTDSPAFLHTLQPLLRPYHTSALILGTGGASKAVAYALSQLGIEYLFVSRNPQGEKEVDYLQASRLAQSHFLIVNATPLGMCSHEAQTPFHDISKIGVKHLVYDLVYNPSETRFMLETELAGATVVNGLDMLHFQADLSWEIWKHNED